MTRPSDQRLVVIDMQHAFADPASGWATEGYDRAEANVRRLAAHYVGRVTWTRFVRDPDEAGAWASYYRRWSQFRVPVDSPLWELTLTPDDDATIVDEPTFSKWGPQLRAQVGDAPLVLCGVATECCVLATAFGAADAGHPVLVVSDACAGASAELHDSALRLLQLNSPLIEVVTTDELLSRQPVALSAR